MPTVSSHLMLIFCMQQCHRWPKKRLQGTGSPQMDVTVKADQCSMGTQTCTHSPADMHAQTHMCAHTHRDTPIHPHTHTHRDTRTHTDTHTHTQHKTDTPRHRHRHTEVVLSALMDGSLEGCYSRCALLKLCAVLCLESFAQDRLLQPYMSTEALRI